jgi:hypothetical protein
LVRFGNRVHCIIARVSVRVRSATLISDSPLRLTLLAR